MTFKDKHIWIISPESWGEQLLSKHHYAMELANRNNDVVFIEPEGKHASVRPLEGYPNIQLISWKSVRGLRKLPRSISKVLQRKEMLKIAELTGGQPDVIWSFDNSRFFDMNAWDIPALKIHHVVDLNQQFELGRAAKSADVCFCTSSFILEELKKYNEHVFNIGHGCMPVKAKSWQEHNQTKKVMYVGNLLIPLLNRTLILDAVREFPDTEFHFVGSYERSNVSRKVDASGKAFIAELKSLPNAHLRGPMQKDRFHETLLEADIFIVAYKKEAFHQVANPHKLPELLSTGRTILSNVLSEYQELDFIEMVDSDYIWLTVLAQMIQDTKKWNTPALQQQRIEWAAGRSYSNQLMQIENLIDG